MPVVNTREYRAITPLVPIEVEENNFIVEGYATTFTPYVLFETEEGEYKEVIDSKAFEEADMTDVIMQYDHQGKVLARQSNGTLELTIDEHGLKVRADLSKSHAAKELYEEIKNGLVTKMSWAFTIDDQTFDRKEQTRIITRVKKVYDVSAVSIPANDGTNITARAFFDGEIEKEKRESLAADIERYLLIEEME